MKKFTLIITIIMVALFSFFLLTQSADAKIRVIKGNNQKIQVGKPAKDPIILKVLDRRGRPIKAVVTFKVIRGEVRLSDKKIKTDSSGRVKAYLKAGYQKGETVIKAYVEKMPGMSVKLRYEITLDKVGKDDTIAKTPVRKPVKPTPKGTPVHPPKITPTPKPAVTSTPVPKITPPSKPPAGNEPAMIIGFDGNNQMVPLGSVAPKELAVQILDNGGRPVEGATVKFKIIVGQASLMGDGAKTDKKGIAVIKIQMGETPGTIAVKAEVVGVDDLSTTFNLKAVSKAVPAPYTPKPIPSPGRPTAPTSTPGIPDTIKLPPRPGTRPRGAYSREPSRISVVGGNYQSAEPGVRLPQPVVVYITDGDGNPTFATVSFGILRGKATVINREVKTDGRGLASTFIIVNSREPIKIVAEVLEKEGLSTIAYANAVKKEPKANTGPRNPIIRATTPSNTPGYPASIAFYEMRAKNFGNIEKTRVIQLDIGVSDFRNAPVSTAIKFSIVKGKIKILTPIVQTKSDGRGICYVEVLGSMGIFTVEAQSMENPDLRAMFKSGPEIRTGPAPKVVRPGLKTHKTGSSDGRIFVKPPSATGKAGKPALLAVIRGGGQKGKCRRKLPNPLVVLITDAKGNPVKRALVSFYMKTGRAVIHSPYARSNERGEARTYITLGKRPGIYEIGVKVRGHDDLKTTIRLEGK